MRSTLLLAFILTFAYFFSSELGFYWKKVTDANFPLNFTFLTLAFFLVLASYLIATVAWRDSLVFSSSQKISFLEAFAIVNINQLTKYIPGKVWGYTLQLKIIPARISKAQVLSLNFLMTISLVLSAMLISVGYMLFMESFLPKSFSLFTALSVFIAYIFMVFGGQYSINLCFRIINHIFGKDIKKLKMTFKKIFLIHALYFFSNLIFGLSAFLVAYGTGNAVSINYLIPIVASVLFADTVGFFSFFVPGGIGVREGLIYLTLNPLLGLELSLVFPLLFRLITIFSDLVLGVISLFLINQFFSHKDKKI